MQTTADLTTRARATLELVRPDSTLLAFLAIALPVFSRSSDATLSLQRAVPLLFASMCTFLVNDLADIDKDRINHPNRPLPTGRLNPSFAVLFYFGCLLAALLSIRFWITTSSGAFLYYMSLVIGISYNYIVETIPALKSLYVAAASTLPIWILLTYYPSEHALYRIALAIFLFIVGRELFMDILDRPGDPASRIRRVDASQIASLAVGAQVGGLVLISIEVMGWLGITIVLTMALLLWHAFQCWFRLGRAKTAIALMKAVMFLGLYFLLGRRTQ